MTVVRPRFRMWWSLQVGAIAALCGVGPAHAQDGPCRPVTFENNAYVVCEIDPRRYDLRLFWTRDTDDTAYGSIPRLARDLAARGTPLAFAMNAGMYHADLAPVGLYVEKGRERVAINTRNGPGNFHLKPNGVLFIAGDRVGVLDTVNFLRARPRVDFATQSGPMLVIDGKLHPKFTPAGQSRKIRNGAGVLDGGRVAFAISDGAVTFSEFARLFRDHLRSANALFLDGSISSLYAPGLGRADGTWPVGPIVGAIAKSR